MRELLDELHPGTSPTSSAILDAEEAAKGPRVAPRGGRGAIFERLDDDEQRRHRRGDAAESVAQIAGDGARRSRRPLQRPARGDGDAILEQLEKVDPAAAEDVREIEKWPETSAGHLMNTAYVAVNREITVRSAIDAVRAYTQEHNENVHNVTR